MRKVLLAIALSLGITGAALAKDGGDQGHGHGNDDGMRFRAHLVGGDLNGNPIVTNATGEASLTVIDHGTALRFRVEIAGIRNLWQAHIHIAAQGPVAPNQPVGPIAFWFVPSSNAAPDSNVSERFDGEMSGGVIMTNAQLTGPLAFDPANAENTGIAGLLKAIGEGRATIVVHTNDLDNSNNQVPGVSGDSPAGEIRGLIQ
ncbi:MAG TPA: CHRD domain-containing protein [Burkholderiales bacterium]|nr:CHRD domain-containing protein [Burkholderiales bacterium]